MKDFLSEWGEAAYTSIGFFWMAFWAFSLGYLISSFIQVFVTEKRMKELMGKNRTKGVLLGTLFGFISSSCSFSALATTKSLFKKGAGFMASLAFLLSSTNLVIELGIIISVFLGWQFVVGEYIGGILLIVFSWILVALIRPGKLIKQARDKLSVNSELDTDNDAANKKLLQKFQTEKNWAMMAKQYGLEWKMVWKDVTIGFTVAGIVAVFIPDRFFQHLFIHSGNGTSAYAFYELLEHVIVGPFVAFITFIGSMGNIPLAALLFGKGVSFAGVMAFIFSDLVVFPVLRINARYYGWQMSLFILLLLFSSLVLASLVLQYVFDGLGILPQPGQVNITTLTYFSFDYSFFLNVAFIFLTVFLVWLGFSKHKKLHYMREMAGKGKIIESILKYIAYFCIAWLAAGIILKFT